MTYFSVRKQQAEAEPGVEEHDEQEDQQGEIEQGSSPPKTLPAALWIGARGPATWLTARFGSTTAWSVHVGSVWAAFFYGGWTALGLTAAWLLAIGAFTPREHLDKLADRIEQRTATEAVAEPTEEAPDDPLITLMWKLIEDAPGVHIKTLAERLTTASGKPVERATVRAALAARSIPVRPSVRNTLGKVNEGVHRDDLAAWEQALPALSPRLAPGGCSGPVATALTCDVGTAATPVATPLHRLRARLSRGAR